MLWRDADPETGPTVLESWVTGGTVARTFSLVGRAPLRDWGEDVVIVHVAADEAEDHREYLMLLAWDAPARGFRDRNAWEARPGALQVIEATEDGIHVGYEREDGSRTTGWLRLSDTGYFVMPRNANY